MPGRPRTPTAILEARGAFVNHPERRAERANEPKPTAELGPPPKFLTKEEKKIWKELAAIIPPGVAMNSDRWTVETAVRLKAKERAGVIKANELSLLVQCLAKLGMTPADRTKVAAAPQPEKPKEANPWDLLSSVN